MIDKIFLFLSYDFVRNALMAGALAALLGSIIGYFVILRKVSFAAHALSHIGFAGATGAALIGLSPLEGMLLLSVGSGVCIGVAGGRLSRSDMAIGMVFSMSLGLGTLFLRLYSGFAGRAKSILFGDILGVSTAQIEEMFALGIVCLGLLALFSRRLLFASTQTNLAEARGLPVNAISTGFMVILAVAVTLASQVVGALLVFTLVVAPAGLALRLCRSFWSGMMTSIFLALFAVCSGIILACLTDYPVTFWITTLFFILYLLVESYCRWFLKSAG